MSRQALLWTLGLFLCAAVLLSAPKGYEPTIGIHNRNPGNIRGRHLPSWKGAVGVDPWDHLIFKSDLDGLRAIRKVLKAYHRKHKLKKLESVLWRWVGPAKDEPEYAQKLGYMKAIVQHTGWKLSDEIDLSDRYVQARLARAIVIGENGMEPYGNLYAEAFDLKVEKWTSRR